MFKYLSLLSKHRNALMGFSIIWIMLYHLAYRPDVPILKDIFNFGYGGVDIFLFLSGFGLYFSMSKENITLTEYYKKRFIRIFPIFWLFLFITFLYNRNFTTDAWIDLYYRATTLGYWILGPFSLWYISCAVFFYAIYPLFFKLFQQYGLKTAYVFIGIGLLLTAIYGFIMVHFYNNINVGNMQILTISRIPIFFIGSIFGYWTKTQNKHEITTLEYVLTIVLFCLSILALLFFNYKMPEYCGTCALYFLPFIIITPILCLIVSYIFEKLHQVFDKIFSTIGSISLELYIVHEFVYIQVIYILVGRFSDTTVILLGFPIAAIVAIALHFLYILLRNGVRKLREI